MEPIQGPSHCELNSLPSGPTNNPIWRRRVPRIMDFLGLTCGSWEHHQRGVGPRGSLPCHVIGMKGSRGFIPPKLVPLLSWFLGPGYQAQEQKLRAPCPVAGGYPVISERPPKIVAGIGMLLTRLVCPWDQTCFPERSGSG